MGFLAILSTQCWHSLAMVGRSCARARVHGANPSSATTTLFQPLLTDDEATPVDLAERYTGLLGELDRKRLSRVAKAMARQTAAVATLCRNVDKLMAVETQLRCIVIALCLWLFQYLASEAFAASWASNSSYWSMRPATPHHAFARKAVRHTRDCEKPS